MSMAYSKSQCEPALLLPCEGTLRTTEEPLRTQDQLLTFLNVSTRCVVLMRNLYSGSIDTKEGGNITGGRKHNSMIFIIDICAGTSCSYVWIVSVPEASKPF
jgi:hypothetical protein